MFNTYIFALSDARASFLMLLKHPADASCNTSSDEPIVFSKYCQQSEEVIDFMKTKCTSVLLASKCLLGDEWRWDYFKESVYVITDLAINE